MARALVVYESLFGDARAIAQAVADGVSAHFPADVVGASDAPPVLDPDVLLLVVGGPNHKTHMPTQATRQQAMDSSGAEVDIPTLGLHEWLETVQTGRRRRRGRGLRHPPGASLDPHPDGPCRPVRRSACCAVTVPS